MIKIECSPAMFRSKKAPALLEKLVRKPTPIRTLYSGGRDRSAIWRTINALTAARLIQRNDVARASDLFHLEGKNRVTLMLNPFDFRLNNVLSSRWMTRVLLILQQNGAQYLRELKAILGTCPLSTLQWVLGMLKAAGVVLLEGDGKRRRLALNQECVVEPSNSTLNIPQPEFRLAIQEFRDILTTAHHAFEAVLLVGKAAHGLASALNPIEIIGILPSNPSRQEFRPSLEELLRAASLTSERTGASISCVATSSDWYHQQLWGCFEPRDSWLSEAVIGIPIIGRCKPASLATLFQEMFRVLPPSVENISRWLKSGTIQRFGDTYTFTMKGINRFRRIATPPKHVTLKMDQGNITLVTYPHF